jgi:anti-sigma factor RsiW
MSRSDCPSQDTLADFVLGKLPDREAGSVAEHLDDCTDCEQKIDRLDGIVDEVVSEL